ncbi:MAG TPA: adenine phosphoribosyltransferase [Gemmatimonadota bacterium]|nr:adenine phosphoribosyltransferase [Gemmatimonadota bacterium]
MTADSLEASLRGAIRDIPDFPKPGILFKDITPVLLDPLLFDRTLDALTEWAAGLGAQKIAGVDARGFLFAAPVANRLGLGLIPIRKLGKLPFQTRRESYDLEYGVNTLEMHADAVAGGERVVVIDDLLATGGTTRAAVRLAEALGGTIAGLGFVVELGFLGGRALLEGYPIRALITFDGPGSS